MAIVTAGPALATAVRHRGLSAPLERAGVVVAIAAGLAISFAGQELANQYSRFYLLERYIQARIIPDNRNLKWKPSATWIAFQLTTQSFIFLGLGGGPALRAYFLEKSRWQEGQRQRELDSLRREKSTADLRLTVLQAQVEPHFLFNTLASVRSLVRQDPQRAEATVDALVDHLRATMPKMRGDIGGLTPTLAEQIEVCASYLALMQVRMGERLQYRVEMPEELGKLAFPPFILISLVENAIKHGVEPKPGEATVWVRAELDGWGDGQRLSVSVEDDGLGLRPGLSDGVGLSNVRAQLAARFGDRASLTLEDLSGGGVLATVRFPTTESVP
jgi:sensor histidine kinase YesM